MHLPAIQFLLLCSVAGKVGQCIGLTSASLFCGAELAPESICVVFDMFQSADCGWQHCETTPRQFHAALQMYKIKQLAMKSAFTNIGKRVGRSQELTELNCGGTEAVIAAKGGTNSILIQMD